MEESVKWNEHKEDSGWKRTANNTFPRITGKIFT